MEDEPTYAVVKKLNRQDKSVTAEAKEGEHTAPRYEEDACYESMRTQISSSGITSLNEKTESQYVTYPVSQESDNTHKKTLSNSVLLILLVLNILQLVIIIALAVSYVQLSKQMGKVNQELKQADEEIYKMVLNHSSTEMQLQQAKEKLTNMTQNKKSVEMQIKEAFVTELHNRNLNECCPKDWKKFDHSCYYFSTVDHSWSEAVKKCKENESNLVMIKTGEQQDFLNKTIWNGTFQYWIGLTDAESEGQWKWVDGNLCECTGENRLYWYDKEPDNWTSTSLMTDEDCAIIRNDGGWSDIKCIDSQKWICQRLTSVCNFSKSMVTEC